jgi:hypothetical protein
MVAVLTEIQAQEHGLGNLKPTGRAMSRNLFSYLLLTLNIASFLPSYAFGERPLGNPNFYL